MPKLPVSAEKKGSAIKTFPSENTQQDTVTKRIRHSTDKEKLLSFTRSGKRYLKKRFFLFP